MVSAVWRDKLFVAACVAAALVGVGVGLWGLPGLLGSVAAGWAWLSLGWLALVLAALFVVVVLVGVASRRRSGALPYPGVGAVGKALGLICSLLVGAGVFTGLVSLLAGTVGGVRWGHRYGLRPERATGGTG